MKIAVIARVLDREPRRRWRWLVRGLCLATLVLGFTTSGRDPGFDAISAAVLVLVAEPFLLTRRTRLSECSVVVGDGRVRLRSRWGLPWVIRGAEVRGACVDPSTGKLVLDVADRTSPLVLSLPDVQSLFRVADALLLPLGVSGSIEWDARVSRWDRAELLTRGFTLVSLVIAVSANIVAAPLDTLGMVSALGLLATFVVFVIARSRSRDALILTPDNIVLRRRRALEVFPRGAGQLERDARGLRLCVAGRSLSLDLERYLTRGISPLQVDGLASALDVAPREDEAASIAELERRDESTVNWLLRLDQLSTRIDAGSAYRGGLSARALWGVFIGGRSSPEARMGAARVLAQRLEFRRRVAEAAARYPEHGRIAIVVNANVEDAARRLDEEQDRNEGSSHR